MLGDALGRIFDLIYGQIVTIPLENTLSYIYVILNLLLNLFAGFAASNN